MCKVGWGYGLPQHIYYTYLDKFLPGASFKTVLKKIVLDEILMAPIAIYLFVVGMNLVEGNGYQNGWKEFKKKFSTVYLVNN